jgi:RimJ/RimL family protein N-acetyltransferase
VQVYLETQRLLLRRFTFDDVPLLVDLDSDPEVMRYVGGAATEAQHIREHLLPLLLKDYEDGERWGMWAALLKPSLDFVGWFHLWPNPAFPEYDAEVGYRLKRTYWGRGLATEGTSALLRKALQDLECTSVCARTDARNAASQRVMQKAGMHFVRDFTDAAAGNASSVLYAI